MIWSGIWLKGVAMKSLNEKLEQLYTAAEVAAHLKVTPAAVYSWYKTGKIEGVVLSKGRRKTTVRFTIQHISNFCSLRKIRGAA